MTIEREREREIRRERRALKRAEKECRRAEREAQLARHENAKQGAGAVVPDGNEPCYFALRNYHPLFYCECGGHIVREDLMLDHDICIDCAEGGGLRRPEITGGTRENASKGTGLPAPIDAGLPLEREQGKSRKALAGQLQLEI